MTTKNRAVTGVLIMVLVLFVILLIFTSYTVNALKDSGGQGGVLIKSHKDRGPIGVVEIRGVIMDAKAVVEKLETAAEDKNIKAIFVRIDSPGGAVAPSQEIYQEILRVDKIKPVYSSMGSVAASGGYYLAAATRKIFANAGTLTGSIGVIMEFADLSKLYEFIKISPEVVKAGKYKDVGSPHRPLTEEERALLKDLIGGVHKQFINDILAKRKDKIKGNMEEMAQGQVFTGETAKKLGLVDEVMGLWEAARQIHKEMGLKEEFGLTYIKEKKRNSLWDILENLDESITNLGLKSNFTQVPMYLFRPGD
ncbi:MAG: signal peptide peptidase SppA [Pseudomonadota bacterium]